MWGNDGEGGDGDHEEGHGENSHDQAGMCMEDGGMLKGREALRSIMWHTETHDHSYFIGSKLRAVSAVPYVLVRHSATMAVSRPLPVSFVSTGEYHESFGYIKSQVAVLHKKGYNVEFIDVRQMLRKNPKDHSWVGHQEDGTHPSTVQAVYMQKQFADLVTDISDTVVYYAGQDDTEERRPCIIVVYCTSSWHRAWTTAETCTHVTNALRSPTGSWLVNANHFPMCKCSRQGRVQAQWETALEWVCNPWGQTLFPRPHRNHEDRFGYRACFGRRQAMESYEHIWRYVETMDAKVEDTVFVHMSLVQPQSH